MPSEIQLRNTSPAPDKPLSYSEYSVEPALAEHILCGWSFVADERLQGTYSHHVLPDGCIALVYRNSAIGGFRPLVVTGPRVKELRVEVNPGDRYWGIKFWPDAGGVILGMEPSDLRERADLLALHSPSLAPSLAAKLQQCGGVEESMSVFQEFVAARMSLATPLDIAVRQCLIAINRCDGSQEIGEIATTLGLSPRQLQRRFRARVGLTPKEYARIRRMRVALANAIEDRPKAWAMVAAETGYSDQSHLSRDAAALTGMTPAGFEARIQPIEHQNVDP
jgi:AraC-like DNA-binding protein